ncbi:MAG: ribonuclease domain-containing protein [Dermatophilaceae bacterium]
MSRSGWRGRPATGLAVVLAVAVVLLAAYLVGRSDRTRTLPPSAPVSASVPAATDPVSGLPWVDESALPTQARQTLALVRRGGPYPYPRSDDQPFGNRERLLPSRPAGYYREYTVSTPGDTDRGPRRVVVGGDGDVYYTDDHYASFRRVREGR